MLRIRQWLMSLSWIVWGMGLFYPAMVLANEEEEVSIGILQYVEHESLSQVYDGFLAELETLGYREGDNLTINYLNAAADNANLQSMSERLIVANDLLLAIATPAAQSLKSATNEMPVYFSAVSDPIAAGLVDSLEQPGSNVTGTLDAAPLAQQVELLQAIAPEAETIGLLYNSGEANSVSEVALVESLLEDNGLKVKKYSVTSTNDIHPVMTPMVTEVDAVFLVSDNTIANAMTLVGELAKEAQLPLIGGSKDMILKNGLATYGLDYYELGKQTARMVDRQLKGEVSVEDQSVEYADHLEIVINEEYAQALGLDLSTIDLSTVTN